MDLKTKRALSIALVIVLLVLINGFIQKRNLHKALIKNHKIVNGRIESFGYAAGGASAPASYSFEIAGKVISNKFNRNSFCKSLSTWDEKILKETDFYIIYNPKNHQQNKILITRDDYEVFNVEIPDKFEIVLQEFIECK